VGGARRLIEVLSACSQRCLRVGLTTCASAAGPQLPARTNLRSTARHRRAVAAPELRAHSARRLHARVRRQARGSTCLQLTASPATAWWPSPSQRTGACSWIGCHAPSWLHSGFVDRKRPRNLRVSVTRTSAALTHASRNQAKSRALAASSSSSGVLS